MKLKKFSIAGFREPALDAIALSEREKDVLRQASAILFSARDWANGGDPDSENEQCTDLALAAHTCEWLAKEGRVTR